MFTADAFIDTIQTGKKTFVNTFVTNEPTKEAMLKFIDSQTEYTKKFVKTNTDLVASVTSDVTKMASEATKYDFSKMFETVSKAWQPKKA